MRPRCLPFLLAALGIGVATSPAENEPETEPPRELRLVSYNIRHGAGVDGKLDLERTARVLRALRPDLVALQEVDHTCKRSGGVDQAAELGRLLGFEHRFGKFMDFQGGQYGLAVLSRHPITMSKRHLLAPGAEPRCALEVVIRPKGAGQALSFVSLHFDWTKEAFRTTQARDLVEALAERDHPVVLAGDFNATPGAASLALIAKAGFTFLDKKGTPTFSADKPTKEIDFIATRGMVFTAPVPCSVHDERVASDHRPVVAVIPYPGGAKR